MLNLRLNHGENRDKYILAIKNGRGAKPWTVLYVEDDDPDFFIGMILSDEDTSQWEQLAYLRR